MCTVLRLHTSRALFIYFYIFPDLALASLAFNFTARTQQPLPAFSCIFTSFYFISKAKLIFGFLDCQDRFELATLLLKGFEVTK